MSKEKWLPFLAAIWFFVTIDSFFTWNRFSLIFSLLPSIIVICGSFSFLSQGKYLKNSKITVILLVVFLIWEQINVENFGKFIVSLLGFIPVLFILFWPSDYIGKMYILIKNIFVFYALGSAIISVLALLGFLNYIPHFELPPQETLHVNLGGHYNVYFGLFPVMIRSEELINIVRPCGMTLEPGHFSIFLGFVYLIERFLGKKINYILIIGAISTFSSAFFVIMIITELLLFLSNANLRKFFKYFFYVPIVLISIFLIYSFLPSETQEQIEYKFYERNLASVVDVLNSTGSLDAALDERASVNSIAKYERLDIVDVLFGGNKIGKGGMLSDYRGFIMNVGLIGFFLSFFAYFSILRNTNNKHALALILSYLLVLLHRSWMLYQPYIYTFAFLSVALCCSTDKWICRKGNQKGLIKPLASIDSK